MKDPFGPESAASKRVLNVGGGSKSIGLPPHFNDWKHLLLDIDPRGGADVVCDARTLGASEAVGAESFDAVYCSHNLEHYYRHDVDKVLRGFLHVLKASGFAEIRVPDIGELVKLLARMDLDLEQEIYKSPAGPVSAHDMIYGYGPEIEASGQDFYAHKTGFSADSLVRALQTNGFGEIYLAPPLAALELHAFAFKTAASAEMRAALALGNPIAAQDRHDAPAPARRTMHATGSSPDADPVEVLYQRAAGAFSGGDWALAAGLCGQALALEPDLTALHYLQGCCRMEQQQHETAVESFTRCLELRPKQHLAAEALARRAMCSARIALACSRRAKVERIMPENIQSISVLICSADPGRSARAQSMYRRLLADLPHEVIVIRDARSLAEGYNRALSQARHEVVVFAHDDAQIVCPDFAARLLRALGRHDLIGVAGTRKLAGSAWHFAGYPHLAGQVGMPGADGSYVVNLYGVTEPETSGLQALDGLLLATRRDIAARLRFDEDAFDGWHLYDLDFSLRAATQGLDCATCNDLLVVHGSQGSYDEHWRKYARRFLEKHRSLGLPETVLPNPELVALPVRSIEEWRLLTEHLIGDAS